eukprot:3315627-Pleurochrysis_carterae.AAC.1
MRAPGGGARASLSACSGTRVQVVCRRARMIRAPRWCALLRAPGACVPCPVTVRPPLSPRRCCHCQHLAAIPPCAVAIAHASPVF